MEPNNTGPLYPGDLVVIAADLGDSMRHFPSDRAAIVFGNYAQLVGVDRERTSRMYHLYVDGHGPVAWYDRSQLTLVAHGKGELIAEWDLTRGQ